MESSRRDLLNNMVQHKPILKNNQNMQHPRFSFPPKTGVAFSKTGVLFLLCSCPDLQIALIQPLRTTLGFWEETIFSWIMLVNLWGDHLHLEIRCIKSSRASLATSLRQFDSPQEPLIINFRLIVSSGSRNELLRSHPASIPRTSPSSETYPRLRCISLSNMLAEGASAAAVRAEVDHFLNSHSKLFKAPLTCKTKYRVCCWESTGPWAIATGHRPPPRRRDALPQ